MPRQNRVTPLGELIADPGRGLVYANRGCLHDDRGQIVRTYNGKRWIACQLQFRGWRRQRLMAPGRFTELFFLDEATALAAGHRPCALCRRADYARLSAVWNELHPGQRGADAIDAQLHEERLDPTTRAHRLHVCEVSGLPDGAFLLERDRPWLVIGDQLREWTPAGYAASRRRPAHGRVVAITPPSLIDLLRGGWEPVVALLHPTATQ